ncbi:MAG: hypothetical protein GX775_01005 [Erysipelothrix sp.]|nr:hypothetical protein [Erysipelothrix sp.]
MTLLEKHREIFKTDKPIIGCVHLMAMPGTPYYDASVTIEQQIERAKREAEILMDLG